MNAAEITDKLGLHSLRQRAWVSHFFTFFLFSTCANSASSYSTSSLPAPPPEMVCMRVLSGSPQPFARPVISRGFYRRSLAKTLISIHISLCSHCHVLDRAFSSSLYAMRFRL